MKSDLRLGAALTCGLRLDEDRTSAQHDEVVRYAALCQRVIFHRQAALFAYRFPHTASDIVLAVHCLLVNSLLIHSRKV